MVRPLSCWGRPRGRCALRNCAAPLFLARTLTLFRPARQGYLIVEGLFDAREVAALQATVESFKQNDLLYDQSTTEMQNFQLHEISECSALLRALPYKPEVKGCLTTLLNGDTDPLEVLGDQMFLFVQLVQAAPCCRLAQRLTRALLDGQEAGPDRPGHLVPPGRPTFALTATPTFALTGRRLLSH